MRDGCVFDEEKSGKSDIKALNLLGGKRFQSFVFQIGKNISNSVRSLLHI